MRIAFAVVALSVSTLAAHADSFTFTSGSTSLTFALPNSPSPDVSMQGTGFFLASVAASFDSMSKDIAIGFYDANGAFQNGGFAYEDPVRGVLFFPGPQVYRGLDSAPAFVDGYYTLRGATLDIRADSATPEPTSFALLATGLLGVAHVARKRVA